MKFDNVKIGDKVWDITLQEWGVVEKKIPAQPNSLGFKKGVVGVQFSNTTRAYTLEGKIDCEDKSPRLFWNEVTLPSDEEDVPPFNLADFLKQHPIKELKKDAENDLLLYHYFWNKWLYMTREAYHFNAITFGEETNIVVETLNKNKVTPEQLKQALKELGWI